MGKTTPTLRMVLETTINEWNSFRRALRKDECKAFDRMMNRSKQYGDAISYCPRLNPSETMAMAILLGQERELYEPIKEDHQKN